MIIFGPDDLPVKPATQPDRSRWEHRQLVAVARRVVLVVDEGARRAAALRSSMDTATPRDVAGNVLAAPKRQESR